jgi:hypothetical protein
MAQINSTAAIGKERSATGFAHSGNSNQFFGGLSPFAC